MIPSEVFTTARLLPAPRAAVWRAWTEAAELTRWFAPPGAALHVEAMAFHPGGRFHYALDLADGRRIWALLHFEAIEPPARLVQRQSFSDAAGGIARNPFSATWPLTIRSTAEFAEEEGGTQVRVAAAPHDASDAEHRTYQAAFPVMAGGWTGTFDRLAAHLARTR